MKLIRTIVILVCLTFFPFTAGAADCEAELGSEYLRLIEYGMTSKQLDVPDLVELVRSKVPANPLARRSLNSGALSLSQAFDLLIAEHRVGSWSETKKRLRAISQNQALLAESMAGARHRNRLVTIKETHRLNSRSSPDHILTTTAGDHYLVAPTGTSDYLIFKNGVPHPVAAAFSPGIRNFFVVEMANGDIGIVRSLFREKPGQKLQLLTVDPENMTVRGYRDLKLNAVVGLNDFRRGRNIDGRYFIVHRRGQFEYVDHPKESAKSFGRASHESPWTSLAGANIHLINDGRKLRFTFAHDLSKKDIPVAGDDWQRQGLPKIQSIDLAPDHSFVYFLDHKLEELVVLEFKAAELRQTLRFKAEYGTVYDYALHRYADGRFAFALSEGNHVSVWQLSAELVAQNYERLTDIAGASLNWFEHAGVPHLVTLSDGQIQVFEDGRLFRTKHAARDAYGGEQTFEIINTGDGRWDIVVTDGTNTTVLSLGMVNE